MDSVLLIGINSGLTFDAVMKMTLGEVTDFAIERYNAEHQGDKKGKNAPKRTATQADWDAFLG